MNRLEAVDRERLVRTFLELVAIDSPSGHEAEIGDELVRRFAELGGDASKDSAGNVIARFAGTGDWLMLSTHMDTAGTDTGIKPIVGDDGVIRTDGSTILGADDKSGIAIVLEVLRTLQDNPDWPRPNLEAVVSVSEEVGLRGSRAMDLAAINSKYGFVLDTAGPIGTITYTAPWSRYLTFTIHGKAAHAGVEPEKGINAVKVAADAIAKLQIGRIDEETVTNIGVIEGGQARNVVPDLVTCQGMTRSRNKDKLETMTEVMTSTFESTAAEHGATVDIEIEDIYAGYTIEPDQKAYALAAGVFEELGFGVHPKASGGGTDGNLYNAAGIACVTLSTGMADEHAVTEHIAIKDMFDAAKAQLAIVLKAGEMNA